MTTLNSIPNPTIVSSAKGLSITSFVLGLVSLACGFVFVVPVIGAVLGFVAVRTEPAGRGFAIAGIWINLAITAFWLLVTTVLIVGLAAGLLTIPLWSN
ncbi:DUF4190 domain-containing protein [Glaciihabitans arcticus]|uniref:DUF4190 domain-containing protein n=1 Tax=Glaciihabitans arcticus TaxID=2668039 RepID=A0A4Q9GSN5_9MICO|nr:DUF4190 domain-containing protein [Glaciihabitans arcticus]TBN58022.1 DUF4190 domain-containing protein [Glaciihabitans arcticus]